MTMSRRGLVLFGAMSLIWGMPYLFIKVAVAEVSPPVVVAARTGLAALVLVPLAIRAGVLRQALARWRPLAAFTVVEMAIPWLLLTDAERRIPSGLTGLLISTVPLAGTVVAFILGDRSALAPRRLLGLAVGMAGVAAIVGLELDGGSGTWWSVLEVMGVAIGYAVAPFIAARHLADVPPLGVVAASLGAVAVVYTPIAILVRPEAMPSGKVIWSLVALAGICTGVAFLTFFALIAEVGPAKSTLITFINPAVAVVLGVSIRGEAFTAITAVGFVLVLAGCALATSTTVTLRGG
jgi:drug/metabolite transporter (DMT)-like permease